MPGCAGMRSERTKQPLPHPAMRSSSLGLGMTYFENSVFDVTVSHEMTFFRKTLLSCAPAGPDLRKSKIV